MSRAASIVLTWAASGPDRCAQPRTIAWERLTNTRRSGAVSGSGSEATYWSSARSPRQSTGALSPVPRGSKPTMSKLSSRGSPKTRPDWAA